MKLRGIIILSYFVLIFFTVYVFADLSPSIKDKNEKIEDQEHSESSRDFNQSDKQKHSINVHLESEGRLLKNKISKNQKSFYPSVPYTELGVQYSKNDRLVFFTNVEVESYNNEWQISFDELGASYSFESIPLFVKAGWFPLPLGYMEENINIFSQDLSIYQSLTRNQEDIGFVADLYIWKEILYLQVSRFGGWFYREWDDFYKAPESAPFITSLKSQGDLWSAFVSWFENDPAFFNPLQALGAGVELRVSHKKLGASVQSEFWYIMQKGQSILSYYVFPKLNIDIFQVGMVWGDISKFAPSFKKSQVESSFYEKIFQVSCKVHPNVMIMGERFITRQKNGPLPNDLWAFRLKLQFDWSKELF